MIFIIKHIKRAKKGDSDSFLIIFKKYEKYIYRMAFIYLKDEYDALDVVQEVAYQSFKKIHTLKRPEYFKTWMIKITINCSIDFIKMNKRVLELNQEYTKNVNAMTEDLSLNLMLKSLIDDLNENEKSVLLLKFYLDYTFKEISEILQIPLGTAKSILYRALNKLKKEYLKGEHKT
ncbi:RNA polymerase sigma-70 factor (ECF subfamily) [Cerasibacillus quisquiliarum]|mgnify:FL=1|uniref:DNA-directed RNA polymerase sigma-70 factor n=1 Tax=Cerasibacillus quisquiliarum TaxID=227865 RepID=A0A511V0J5_9BACI|nr:sigma-70 family RNA polymerase sigma factor [Cerasibacillus quisquiliarum]MBB5147389.1 RNA polymerase sigma-70 factor (ECF subfamily) [Cerasibacillus quisquiliarum]GEN32434.1 DNA-directed RNA polymerase sigma-70 factor [Cerasibacillus quisquiliarum]